MEFRTLAQSLTQYCSLGLTLSCAVPYQKAEGLDPNIRGQIHDLAQPLLSEHIGLNAQFHAQVPANCDYTLENCPELSSAVAEF